MTEPEAYFELFDDMSTSNRWYQSGVTGRAGEWLGVALSSARKYEGPTPLQVEVFRDGPALELTVTNDVDLVVNERVARILEGIASADIQFIPAVIAGHPDPHFVVNMLFEPDCIDEQRTTDARRYTAEDGRPERIGRFKSATGLKIDPTRTGGRDIFRPWGWAVAIVVSAKVADALRAANVRCKLTPVT